MSKAWMLTRPLLIPIAILFGSMRLESSEAPSNPPAPRHTHSRKVPRAESRGSVLAPSSATAVVQSPGIQFSLEGLNFDQDQALTDFYNIPPDPCGAVGPGHLVSVVNTAIQWCDKSGGNQVSKRLGKNGTDAIGSFFETLNPTDGVFDPKVVYDQHAGRFVVVTLEQIDTHTSSLSRILLAVSASSDPNGSWYFKAIDSKLRISNADCWADYPGLAVDEEAIYITANLFRFNNQAFAGARFWIVNKAPFYSGGAASVNVYDPGTGFSFQPAHVYGASGVAPNVGTFLVSTSDNSGNALRVVRVDNPLGAVTLNTQVLSLGSIHNTAAAWPDAPQAGSSAEVSTNDNRTINALWRDNRLYAVNTVNPPSGPDAGQATAHWYSVDTSTLSALTLLEQGNIGGEEIATATATFMPSIAVDKFGNMAVGFSASASSIYPGAYYSVRSAGGTFQPPGTVASGLDYYFRTFSGSENRWGDYSATVIDPSDELTFWVFNEYAISRGTILLPTYPSQDGRWATRWAKFQVAKFKSDFDADRKDDILFRHPSTGDVLLWIMNGIGVVSR